MTKTYCVHLLGLFLLLFPITFYSQTCDSLTRIHTGEGTFYGGVAGSSGGNCGLPVAIDDSLHCAMNNADYAHSNACGACVRVWGPTGTTVLKVVDRCPECAPGDIDMTPQAFKALAQERDGRIDISWQFVPCPLSTSNNIKIYYKEGSSQFWIGIQFRDLRYPIRKLEYQLNSGEYITLTRALFNFWIQEGGLDEDKSQAGPYNFRITDYNDQVITVNNVPFAASTSFDLGTQFPIPPCEDCNGEINGSAALDNCGVCSGGTTGIEPNSTCEIDCNGYWEGTAFLDGCGRCVAGTTGATPCDADCSGALGGSAFLDNCNECVGGNTGNIACMKDCNNEWGGDASIDDCELCSGGNTGLQVNSCITGLNPNFNKDQLVIWPNPVVNFLNLKEKTDWEIVDFNGVIIKTGSSERINVEELIPGIYILKSTIGQTKFTIEKNK